MPLEHDQGRYMGSVTRCLDYFFNIWPCTTLKICQSRLKFRQILNKTFEICKRLLKICQSGEISLHLVTLYLGIAIPFVIKRTFCNSRNFIFFSVLYLSNVAAVSNNGWEEGKGSVTHLGEIFPLWPNLKSIGQFNPNLSQKLCIWAIFLLF